MRNVLTTGTSFGTVNIRRNHHESTMAIKRLEKTVQMKGRISEPLAIQVKTLLMDPLTGAVTWGAYSDLLEQLLTDWVDSQRIEAKQEGTTHE